MAAAPTLAGDGVSHLDAAMGSALRDHPWVAQACAGASGMVVLATAEGVAALCRMGRAAFVRALGDAVVMQEQHAVQTWRLVDAWPVDASASRVDALLSEPRPTDADVLDETRDDASIVLTLRIPVDLKLFDVHFPALPILPGVVQLAWVLAQGARHFGTPLTCRRVELLKFQRPLRPGEQVQLSLRHERALHRLHFRYATPDVEFSSGRLQWERADD